MLLAVSGTVPEEPVVCKTSGHLFEKRLIEKHIKVLFCNNTSFSVLLSFLPRNRQQARSTLQDTGKDPVTGAETNVDELLVVKNNTVRYHFQLSGRGKWLATSKTDLPG